MDIATRHRNDNPIVVAHARSLNSVTKERWWNGLLEGNSEDSGGKSLFRLITFNRAIKHFRCDDKNNGQAQDNLDVEKYITDGEREGWDVIRKPYPADKQNMAFPETKEGRSI